MTLNQIKARLEVIAQSHQQLRSFYFGSITDWLTNTEGKVIYPACVVEHGTSRISSTTRLTTHSFKIWLLDLVNKANNADDNQLEVISDMMGVAEDLVALFRDPSYQDTWFTDGDAAVTVHEEKLNDYTAGVSFDINISSFYPVDRCAAPVTE